MDHVKEQIHWEAAYEMGLTGKGAGVAVLEYGTVSPIGILKIESRDLRIW